MVKIGIIVMKIIVDSSSVSGEKEKRERIVVE